MGEKGFEEVLWIALDMLPGIGAKGIQSLYSGPGIQWFLTGDPVQVAEYLNIKGEAIAALRRALDLKQAKQIFNRCGDLGIMVVTLASAQYPPLLKTIYDPPPVLYCQGKLPGDELCLAMVGSRRATAYGRSLAAKMAGQLAQAGISVVSGLALGIDTYAHQGALAAGGYTIAVLGNGLDIYYPPQNRKLQQDIAAQGCVISEFPPGVGPKAWHFPRRNRIVSGLCRGVIVVEAAMKSGAMITVGFALDQGRDVFALPGNVNSPQSEGTNRMIQQGAVAVLSINDILSEYGMDLEIKKTNVKDSLTGAEKNVLALLDFQGVRVDDLCRSCRLPGKEVLGILVTLELKGLAVRLPGQRYARTR